MRDTEYSWADAMLSLITSDASTAIELARQAGLDPKGEDVSSIDLSGLDLRGQDFRGWNLASAAFDGAVLSGADFRGAKLDPQSLIMSDDWDSAILDKSLRDAAGREEIYHRAIKDLDLSVRTANILDAEKIRKIGDLIQKTEAELLRTQNFGRKSLNEVKEVLAQMGLHLGMDVPKRRPASV